MSLAHPAKLLRQALSTLGLQPQRLAQNLLNLPHFLRTARAYAKSTTPADLPLRLRNLRPILTEFASEAGSAQGHYFHQDLWAAQLIFNLRPSSHIDVGSRLDGFVAHLLTFMPVDVIDIRPLTSPITNLRFIQEDATTLSRFHDNSIPSISSLHAVEHFGLGRYSDPIDPAASSKAMHALARVLQPNGQLYFSVPIGRQRLEFNAHRIFSPITILQHFSALHLLSFSAVDDDGRFLQNATPSDFTNAHYSCGLFHFTKPHQ